MRIIIKGLMKYICKSAKADGGAGSGNFGHGGRPGKVGGSSSAVSEKNGLGKPKPSARGRNSPCNGFGSKAKEKRHFSIHGQEVGANNITEYVEKAKAFLQQECKEPIDGYLANDGRICRFNKETGEIAYGFPNGDLKTFFNAGFYPNRDFSILRAQEYFMQKKYDDTGNEPDY